MYYLCPTVSYLYKTVDPLLQGIQLAWRQLRQRSARAGLCTGEHVISLICLGPRAVPGEWRAPRRFPRLEARRSPGARQSSPRGFLQQQHSPHDLQTAPPSRASGWPRARERAGGGAPVGAAGNSPFHRTFPIVHLPHVSSRG